MNNMHKRPTLILVMGLPATGKTTVSKQIATALQLPIIARDEIKVKIMDEIGWGDREWSKKVGKASYSLLYYFIDQLINTHASFVVESDFAPEHANERLMNIHKRGYDIIQIICSASDDIIIERWKSRALSDQTHPSSTEGEQGLSDIQAALAHGPRQPLDIPGSIFHLDTGEDSSECSAALIQQLQILIANNTPI